MMHRHDASTYAHIYIPFVLFLICRCCVVFRSHLVCSRLVASFTDPKARAAAAKRANPALRKQQSSAFYAVSTFDQSSLDKMIDGGWELASCKDEAGKTVLHRAAQVGNAPAVASLLKSGSSVDALTQWKATPLHMAARNNKVAVVKALVEAGASTKLKTYGGDTALEIAQKYKFKDLAAFLDGK